MICEWRNALYYISGGQLLGFMNIWDSSSLISKKIGYLVLLPQDLKGFANVGSIDYHKFSQLTKKLNVLTPSLLLVAEFGIFALTKSNYRKICGVLNNLKFCFWHKFLKSFNLEALTTFWDIFLFQLWHHLQKIGFKKASKKDFQRIFLNPPF